MLVAFHALAVFVETPLLLWSERVSVRRFSTGALSVLGVSMLLAGLVPHGGALLLAFAIYGPASGCALAVAQGALVDRHPEARERMMARAYLAGCAGDLAVPMLLGGLAAVGLGWRTAFVLVGALTLALAVGHTQSRALPDVASAASDEPTAPMRQAIQVALRTRGLLAWSLAAAATSLLDEVLVAFGTLHLAAMGATAGERSWAVAGWTVGGFVGLVVLERTITPARARRALLVAAAVSASAVIALASTTSVPVAMLAFFVIGLFGAALHPLATARAYASLPGRPAVVNAVHASLVPLDMLSPIVLGAVAARFGAAASVLALLAAPIAVAVAAARRPASSAVSP